nr:hypothetical protein [uncultured Capnocytophaga sp.]
MKKIKQLISAFAFIISFLASAQSIQITTIDGEEVSYKGLEKLASSDFSKLKEVRILNTSGNVMAIDDVLLKKILDNSTHLESLEIKEIGISTFPEITSENTTLKTLILRLNGLSKLPNTFGKFIGLETIDLYNPISEVPDSFINLKRLENLKFEGVELVEFPEQVFSFSNLKSLIISQFDTKNKIKSLPDMFDKLPLLEELSVRNAALSEVPASVGRLPKLENVYFNANNLVKLPQSLAENSHLTYVNINNNPLDFKQFIKSIEKIQWKGVFYINNKNFSSAQYEEVEKRLPKISVFYTQKDE